MNDKIIPFRKKTKFQKIIEAKRMLFLVIIVGSIVGMIAWNYFIENVAQIDVVIPQSQNITYNNEIAKALRTDDLSNEFDNASNAPILLYIYTSWCSSCKKFTPVINELSSEFQNTDLKILAVAIDKDISSNELNAFLNQYGDVYFEPKYLYSKEGFMSFLKNKGVRYNKRIPYTVLFSVDREVIASFSGVKSKNYLRNKIIKELNL